MNAEDEIIIKPPFESVKSGKIFKPSKAYRNKVWFEATIAIISIWALTIGIFFGIMYLVSLSGVLDFVYWLNVYGIVINLWYWGIGLIIYIPYMLFVPIYINSYEYSLMAKTGTPMPEILKRSGIINIEEKVVPLRSITNVSSLAGPFDRIFKIGCVLVETAGYSGAYQTGPELKISGTTFYRELKDWLVMQLRKFKEPYVIGTEIPYQEEITPENIDRQIIILLEEIRNGIVPLKDMLLKLEKKLDEN
jgi:membrane protein YdbS with pleckstrin-like domain